MLCYEHKARLFWRHLVELNDTLKGKVNFSILERRECNFNNNTILLQSISFQGIQHACKLFEIKGNHYNVLFLFKEVRYQRGYSRNTTTPSILLVVLLITEFTEFVKFFRCIEIEIFKFNQLSWQWLSKNWRYRIIRVTISRKSY